MLGRFQEAIRIWQEAFRGERFDFAGKYWQAEHGVLAPAPYQSGGWPIWGGGNASPAAIRRSAEYAACWTCDPFPLMKEVWDEQAGAYRDHAREL
jgi:alkanesulfonate monooxygenase SsuD/methylene tetrahydromethanopterin reductase-like flavin-dependent oxidoreductase (luciferase family)